MRSAQLFKDFFNSEKAGGITLIACTIVSLSIANSVWGDAYTGFWNIQFAGHSLVHWINDGLMTIFFLLIGLELEREIYEGELSNLKDTILPIMAAIGGMAVPAIIYLSFNAGTITQSGAGIPMATDIAFAIGILSLLGKRVPTSLKIFLTALAVIDDLGAILVIAIFYSKGIVLSNLLIAIGIFLILLIFNRLKLKNLLLYTIGGLIMWYFMLQSGVHATITGVLLAFTIPFGNGSKTSPSYLMEHLIHKPVAFFILPLFALANTAIVLGSDVTSIFSEPYSMGIAFGLIVGKPMGIILFSFAAILLRIAKLPSDINWKGILGVGFLAGIGFTMSIFITLLAFDNQIIIENSKFIILCASCVAAIIGFVFLKLTLPKTIQEEEDDVNFNNI